MKEKVIKFIEKHKMLAMGDKVLVAVSGGPDSICLLHILYSLRELYNIELLVIHINHLLRGKEADQEEEYVRDLSREWNIPFYGFKKDIKSLSKLKGISIEEVGREVRYNLFIKMKASHQVNKIALGQHGDDNAETIIMRLLRGTGPEGLAGIPPYREDGIIRPLLACSREEIEEYCRNNKLFPKIDKSNLEPIYFRNKIRLEVLPYLEQYNNNLKRNLQNLSEIVGEQQDYIKGEMDKLWKDNIHKEMEDIKIDISWINNLSNFEQKEMLRRSIERVKGNLKDIEYKHIQLILEKLREDNNTIWEIDLPNNIKIERQYNKLLVREGKSKDRKDFYYPLVIEGKTLIPEINGEFNLYLVEREDVDIIKSSPTRGYFDIQKIEGPIFVRNRIPGDKFKPSGNLGTKKLKDFFIDKKIPREQRDTIPLVVGENGIIWVTGYRVDERYIVDEKTKTILIIEFNNKGGKPIAQRHKEDINRSGCSSKKN